MFMNAYKCALDVIKEKPMRLWGLSLMSVFICIMANLLSVAFIPVGIAFGYIIGCGMTKVYIDGLHRREVNSDQLFDGFKRFWRIAGGMAWKDLWICIWFIIPIAGPIIAICKAYQYRFVPYILANEPDVTATQALRLSMEKTNGKKGQMFLADIIFGLATCGIMYVLTLFGMIPFIGILFSLVNLIWTIIVSMFSSIFRGLYGAAFYEMPAPEIPAVPQYVPEQESAE